jgi:hypothetical protein
LFTADNNDNGESNDGDDGDNAKKRKLDSGNKKSKSRARQYGTVSYASQRDELSQAVARQKQAVKNQSGILECRKAVFDLVKKFAKLENPTGSNNPDAVDGPSHTWVNKMRDSAKKYAKCIETCWMDKGGIDGFMALPVALASSEYKCKCQ